jgi:chromosome partitioning protein
MPPSQNGTTMKSVTLLNQKGGVGKTSTTFHLGGTLAKLGRRVLVIDIDPQATLTQAVFGSDAAYGMDPSRTIAAVLRGDDPTPERVIRPTPFANLDILPGSGSAKPFNVPEAHLESRVDRTCLRPLLAEVANRYDYVLLDPPPNLHLCSWVALAASHAVLIPMQPEDPGAQGIRDVHDSVRTVREADNPGLRILGYLPTMFKKSLAIHAFYDGQLRELYGELVFAVRVPDAADFKEAFSGRKPVSHHKPKGAAASAIRDLATEFEGRLTSMFIEKEVA